MMKNTLLKLATNPNAFFLNDVQDEVEQEYVDFRKLLGETAWNRLVPAVRQRFATAQHRQVVRYGGTMTRVDCNVFGWLLAQCCRLLGTPLTPQRGRDIETIVSVYDEPRRKGTVWEREYRFPGKAAVVIRSTKCLDLDKSLLESVDGGVRMRLRVYEEEGQLVFVSTDYFLELLGLRLPLPRFLTPGETEVRHIDLADGNFRFTLTIRHPLFGLLFYQDGVFRLEEV